MTERKYLVIDKIGSEAEFTNYGGVEYGVVDQKSPTALDAVVSKDRDWLFATSEELGDLPVNLKYRTGAELNEYRAIVGAYETYEQAQAAFVKLPHSPGTTQDGRMLVHTEIGESSPLLAKVVNEAGATRNVRADLSPALIAAAKGERPKLSEDARFDLIARAEKGMPSGKFPHETFTSKEDQRLALSFARALAAHDGLLGENNFHNDRLVGAYETGRLLAEPELAGAFRTLIQIGEVGPSEITEYLNGFKDYLEHATSTSTPIYPADGVAVMSAISAITMTSPAAELEKPYASELRAAVAELNVAIGNYSTAFPQEMANLDKQQAMAEKSVLYIAEPYAREISANVISNIDGQLATKYSQRMQQVQRQEDGSFSVREVEGVNLRRDGLVIESRVRDLSDTAPTFGTLTEAIGHADHVAAAAQKNGVPENWAKFETRIGLNISPLSDALTNVDMGGGVTYGEYERTDRHQAQAIASMEKIVDPQERTHAQSRYWGEKAGEPISGKALEPLREKSDDLNAYKLGRAGLSAPDKTMTNAASLTKDIGEVKKGARIRH